MEQRGIKGRITGGILLIWGYLTLYCASFLLIQLLPIFFASPGAFRHIYDRLLVGPWLCAIAGWQILVGMRIVSTGDSMQKSERSLIIMNHRTHLDWMYFWPVMVRQSDVSTEKIILKSEIKKLPGAGWSMQGAAYLFIKRKWEEDKVALRKFIDYFSAIDYKTQQFINEHLFGTAVHEGDLLGIKLLRKRLNIQNMLLSENHLDAVYDVTLGFPDHIPQHILDIPTGNYPKEVHFHIKRYGASNLPSTGEGLSDWCKTIWAEKEERLRLFYKDRKFAAENECSSTQRESKLKEKHARHRNAHFLFILAIFYYTSILVMVAWSLYNFAIARYCVIVQGMFFTIMSHKLDGFEMFQIDYFNWFFNKKRSIDRKQQ